MRMAERASAKIRSNRSENATCCSDVMSASAQACLSAKIAVAEMSRSICSVSSNMFAVAVNDSKVLAYRFAVRIRHHSS